MASAADVHTAAASYATSSPGFPVTLSDEIFQIVNQPDLKTLAVRTIDSTVFPPTETTFTFSSSFTVTSMAARGQNDLYIAGTARNGDLVIEHWEIDSREGAVRTGWQTPGLGGTPVGQPSPVATPVSTITGGVYIPAAQRIGEPGVVRTEVLRTDLFLIQENAFGVDPEGRFLLFVTDDAELYRLDLTSSPSPPVMLHDSTTLWTLPYVTGTARIQVTGVGRVWVLGPEQALPNPALGGTVQLVLTYLYDADNDGLFEQAVVHDYLALANSGMWDSIETDFAFIYP